MTLKTPGDELGGLFVADISALAGANDDVVNYNIAPTDAVVVLRADEGVTERRALSSMRWGLVPHWARDPSVGTRMLNARVETVDTKPAYREVFRNQRCLVVADGFYEWQTLGRRKQPWWFHRQDARPMLIAGMWSRWVDPQGRPLHSATIVTREGVGVVGAVHDRMPAVLDEAYVDAWLDADNDDPERLKALLESHADLAGREDIFEAWPVDPAVNHVRAEGPACIEPIELDDEDEEDPGSGQGSLF